ncbi:MAG TPA: fumarylacetoacetate hydrolase family protein [Bacillota bacterium]|nr:fumarylacetoacetate hydrolase family protein [Bacillota bacterium]HOA14976.1 fumarylacetoacetate hydrolase family protein [Bacillota bacterium]
MKLAKFEIDGGIRWGVIEDGFIHTVQGQVYSGLDVTDERFRLEEVKLLAPAHGSCGKLIMLGVNYRSHFEEAKSKGWNVVESDEPVLFMTSRTALCGHMDDIVIANPQNKTQYEAELVIVIGKEAVNVTVDRAGEHILGYCCGNDISDRNIQQKDGQWMRSKSYATYKPMGPWIETVRPKDSARVILRRNGRIRQDAPISDMIFGPERIVSYVSSNFRLDPGDVIFTGTPSGVGSIKPGDVIEVEIEGVGKLVNRVSDARKLS